jgi:hypothetical protein
MPTLSNRSINYLLRAGSPGLALSVLVLLFCGVVLSRQQDLDAADSFKVGERLTYTVGFERFSNVAYAEFYTVSRGRIGDVEAVELKARVKTLDFLSAAFYLIDESRTIFASPASGLPLYVSRSQSIGGLPKETVQNYLNAPTGNYDLITMIYKIRHSQGSGAFNIYEGERVYPVMFQLTGNEKVRTDAGEFDTTVHSVQCEYFTELGIRELKINLSTDEARVPIAIRFRTPKGEFRARIASIQDVEPQVEPAPVPVPISTPRPSPAPTPTPRAYTDNVPLPADLSFVLGETLEYRITTGGQPVGNFTLQARERKQFQGNDSLLLAAVVTDGTASGGLLTRGDSIFAQVNPETLSPSKLDIALSGPLANLNQSAIFNQASNLITFKGTGQVESPVGTHSILSLVYAIRSFNLKPSKDSTNPINDTRVAVFWDERPYIFTLRPAPAETVTINGTKVSAQRVTVSTGNPQLDALSIKIWLSNDARRLPVRFDVGSYQAELISEKNIQPK